MSFPRSVLAFSLVVGSLTAAVRAQAAPLILDGTGATGPKTLTLGGVHTYDSVTMINGARLYVTPYNGVDKVNTGNLVLKADSISVDATSMITAKGAGYQGALCQDGTGPAAFPASGGRGGCAVRDSGGGGAHRGIGGRGTTDAPTVFPAGYEEDCGDALNGTLTACADYTNCRNNDGLPTVAGLPFQHSIYATEFGAAGGDKGCRDNDGFALWPGTTVALAAGAGGGRIVLFAANSAQTGQLTIAGVINGNGARGCGNGNDSAGAGAGGSVLLIGDSVTINASAQINAAGGRGGDEQPKCLTCASSADCGGGSQTCVAGRCSPCNCTPCTASSECIAALGQTCKALGAPFGNVCADASNLCTPVPVWYDENECKGSQNSGTCDDCAGGGGGGIVNVLSRVASISPQSTFNVSGAAGGVCPICTGEAGGGAGELQIDGAYVGEVCDGWDNDFNGLIDDGLAPLICAGVSVPSCVAGIPQQCPVDPSTCKGPVTDTRPRFAVIVDTSGSMLLDPAGNPTFGDGSVGHLGVDTSSDADLTDGNNSKLFIAKGALNNVLAAFTDADFSLARYHQDVSPNRSCQTASWFECQQSCCSYDDPRNNIAPPFPIVPGCDMATLYPSAGYSALLNVDINVGWSSQSDCINYAGSCGSPRRGADFLVGFGKSLQQQLMWLDGKETSFNSSTVPGNHCNFAGGGDCELRATGPTPLAGSLDAAADFLKPIIQCDGGVPCRKYSVILLTDGAESCMGDPVASATALKTTVAGVAINTYVIGFSVLPAEQAQLNAIAAAGGTGSAFFASDQSSLSNALAAIVASSTNFETCNGLDDNCNNLIDEDFPDKGAACDDGLLGVCKGTGIRVCNGSGTGTVCQITNPGQAPGVEVCNGLDDNCNGLIDEGGVCLICSPSPEVCNGLDDDCNGQVDDNPIDANKPCGLSLGECAPGLTVCIGGSLSCVGVVGPKAEVCDGLDNDCDGVIDGMTASCYSGPPSTSGVGVCHPGSQACTAVAGSGIPSWGACVGEVDPSTEVCDGLDNDCNGLVDDQVSDGNGHVTGEDCCRFGTKCGTGECTYGQYACAGSQVVCDGGVAPSAEQCDGLDNDCNGVVDDVAGKGMACAMPGGCPGTLQCQTGVGLVCEASATGVEICNGIDDDCDGSIDEEPEVTQNDPKVGALCDEPKAPNDQPPCKAGKTICKAGSVVCVGAVPPSTEVCNGIDDDCNGTIDEPNPCTGGQTCRDGECLSPCASGEFPCPGGQVCVDKLCVPIGNDAGADSGKDSGKDGASGGAGGTSNADAGDGASEAKDGAGAGGKSDTGAGGSAPGADAGTAAEDRNNYGLTTGGGGCACSVLPASHNRSAAAGGLLMVLMALRRRSRSRAGRRADMGGVS